MHRCTCVCVLQEELFDDSGESESPPPSGLGFRDNFESSLTTLAEVDLLPVEHREKAFVATLIQQHAFQNHSQCVAGAQPSGINPRVDNIVRAFDIKGPLDKELLAKAINSTTNLHPILGAQFEWRDQRLYLKTPQGLLTAFISVPGIH